MSTFETAQGIVSEALGHFGLSLDTPLSGPDAPSRKILDQVANRIEVAVGDRFETNIPPMSLPRTEEWRSVARVTGCVENLLDALCAPKTA